MNPAEYKRERTEITSVSRFEGQTQTNHFVFKSEGIAEIFFDVSHQRVDPAAHEVLIQTQLLPLGV